MILRWNMYCVFLSHLSFGLNSKYGSHGIEIRQSATNSSIYVGSIRVSEASREQNQLMQLFCEHHFFESIKTQRS